MLVGPAFPPPQPLKSVEAPTMAIVMLIAVRRSPLPPHSLADVFMAVHHREGNKGGNLGSAPPVSANYNKLISCCTGHVDQPTIGR